MASTFRLASFNVENLFERPKAMNLGTWEEGKPILEQHARINQLINQAHYSAPTMKEKVHQASDHAAIYADIKL